MSTTHLTPQLRPPTPDDRHRTAPTGGPAPASAPAPEPVGFAPAAPGLLSGRRRRLGGQQVPAEALLAALHRYGLRGHGGAGFPTATKIASALDRRPHLIVNACDGEPLVDKDAAVLSAAGPLLADGIALLVQAVAPRTVSLAVHRDSASAASAHELIRREPALRGASVLAVPHRYVASEGTALASLRAGGEARPTFALQPSTQAPGDRSTLVLNAETVARVAAIWLDAGTYTPTRLVSLAGDITRPGVREVSPAATVGELIAAAGPTRSPRHVLLGGFGGRWWSYDSLATLDLAALDRELGAGLVFAHGGRCLLPVVGDLLRYLAEQSAGQCGPCMFGLPALAADWQQLGDLTAGPAAAARLERRLPVLVGRGACKHPDATVAMAASAFSLVSIHLRDHWQGSCGSPAGHRPGPWTQAGAR